MSELDPIRVEIIRNALVSAAEEMSVTSEKPPRSRRLLFLLPLLRLPLPPCPHPPLPLLPTKNPTTRPAPR